MTESKVIVLDYLSLMSDKKLTDKEQKSFEKLWESLSATAKKFRREGNVYTRIGDI